MRSSSRLIRAYSFKHNQCGIIAQFISDYKDLLQTAIDEVWTRIRWREEKNCAKFKGVGKRRDATRLIPIIPSEGSFKHHILRNSLMKKWGYSKHYVDSAIKQTYSILHSWRKNYVKGFRRREKPIVTRRFVRIKETLYSYRDGILKISISPHKEYVMFDLRRAWFYSGIRNLVLEEIIMKEDTLTVTVSRRVKLPEPKVRVAWDSNEASMDGFSRGMGWIKVDLSKLYHIHRVYEIKRQHLQRLASKKSSIKQRLAKCSEREKHRAKDELHKITSILSKQSFQHFFERLDKHDMYTKGRRHNARISKANWKMFKTMLSYKSSVGRDLNTYNSTRRCTRCGGINKAPNGVLYECEYCGLRISRQLNASVNLYLQMEGLSPSQRLFEELMRGWSGFTQTGSEGYEAVYELVRPSILVNSKGYVCLSKTT